mgnify:CR=1 FL=1
MRFDAIELRRFGIFESHTIDLSKGSMGVHIIHGPNEAGKSTTLKALRWMLFGFPHGTQEFLYGNDTRIGGVLQNGEQRCAFLRKKGRVRTLESPGKESLEDDALAPFLGGVSLELFDRLYGLNHSQLTAGGQDIVQAQGEAGQALFSAAGGLQSVRGLAKALQTECDEIFKPRAAKASLSASFHAITEAKKRRNEATISADDYRKLERAVEEAQAECDALSSEREKLVTERDWLERCRKAYQHLTALHAVRAAIEEMGDTPALSEDFRHDRERQQAEWSRAQSDEAAAADKLTTLRERFEALEVDDHYLEQSEAIQQLAEEAATVHTALKDRAETLEPELRGLREQVSRVLRDLGREDAAQNPRAILPTAPARAAVAELAEAYSGLAERLESAERAEQQAKEALETAEQALATAPEPVDTNAVEAALSSANRILSDAERLEDLEQRIIEQREQLEVRLLRLGRWSGALDQARALAVPDEATIARFMEEFAESDRTRKEREKRQSDLTTESARLAQDIAKLERGESIPTGEELDRLREARDVVWSVLRDAWLAGQDAKALPDAVRTRMLDAATADGFAGSDPLEAFSWRVQRADEAADRLRREAERVAEYATATAQRDQVAKELEAVARSLEELGAGRDALEKEWAAIWKAPGIAHGTPSEMSAWGKEWAALIRDLEQHASDAAEERRVRQRVDAARADLMDTWRTAYPAASDYAASALEDTVAAAGSWAKEARQASVESASLSQECQRLRDTELPAATAAVKEASKAMRAWRKQWAGHMKSIGLEGEALPRQAAAMLEGLDTLRDALDALDDKEQRIEAINARHDAFKADAAKVFKAAGYDPGAASPVDAARTLNALRERHARDRTTRDDLARRIEEEEENLRACQQRVSESGEALRSLCEDAGVDEPSELPEAEQAATQLRALLAKESRLQEELAREAAGENLDAFESRVLAEDAESLAARIDALNAEHSRVQSDYDAARERLGAERTRQRAVDGANDAAAAEQDLADESARALTLMEEYARLSLAQGMLTSAVQRYQEKNQGPMLARASHYFRELTRGSFHELRASYDDKGQAVLLGVRPDEREVFVGGMSDGTADQLYLALRLAAIELRAERENPMPLILDDVLINFDDERAAAALTALAAFASHTQVLMFTHHAHLVELARATLDSKALFVHELPANGAGST